MKIILNYGTHGNERTGLYVARAIKKLGIDPKTIIIQRANPKAFTRRRRFIDQDLNRSFPGKKRGNYEARLAYKLSPIIKSADVVIDIHSTNCHRTNATIVTKLDARTKDCLRAIAPRYVLVMNATKNNALISQAKLGIGFEYGKDDRRTIQETTLGVKRLLNHLGAGNIRIPKAKTKTKYFNVVAAMPKPRGFELLKGIKNYQLVRAGQAYATNGKKSLIAKHDFYPILFGEKSYKNIFGFSGQIITDP